MIRCRILKPLCLALLLLLSAHMALKAGAYDSLRPRFNYAIMRELKSTGAYNVLNLQVGAWIEYAFDSGAWKESIDRRDAGKNLCPPHKIVIIKFVGDYADGKRNGEWKCYRTYDSKQPLKWELMETRSYSMGQLHGSYKAFYSNGKVLEEYEYRNGKENGTYRSYTRDGKVIESTEFVNGRATGKSEYYAGNGVLVWSGELLDGLYHGIVKEFYFNGQLRSSVEYKKGREWNVLESYSHSGTPLDKGMLTNGTGYCYQYGEGGELVARKELKDGLYHGMFRSYYLNGNVEAECEYRNDSMNGVYRDFYPEGGLRSLKAVVDGVVNGPAIQYYKSGKLKSEWLYRKGTIWATVYANDPEGRKIDCGNLKMGSGTVICYDDSGRLSQKIQYAFGLTEGVTEDYHTNGKLGSTTTYLLGLVHGEHRIYNEQGLPEATFQYNEGLLDGLAVHYHSNGKIYEEIYFYRGRLWELISIRDSNDKKLNPGTLKQGNGKLNGYYPGGKLYSVCEMSYGLSHGSAVIYYENGAKYGEYQYAHDSLVGVEKEYWLNGQLAAEHIRNEWGKSEKVTQYHSNGRLWTVWEYESGLLWNVDANFDVNGVPHNKGTFSNGTGTLLRYDEKDSVIFEYQFIKGTCLNCESDNVSIYK